MSVRTCMRPCIVMIILRHSCDDAKIWTRVNLIIFTFSAVILLIRIILMAIEPSNDRLVPLFGADAGLVIGHPQRVGNNLIRWEHWQAEAETD